MRSKHIIVKFDHLGLAFLGDVVEGVVDGIGEFLYELVRGDLIDRHSFHCGTADAQVEYFLAGALEVEEPSCSCYGVVLEDLIGEAGVYPNFVQPVA